MPSYTKEQRERALEVLEECEGRVTLAITKLGYPSRQTMYQWINGAGAARTRTAGRPFSHYDPQLKEDAVRMVRGAWTPGTWLAIWASRALPWSIIGRDPARRRPRP